MLNRERDLKAILPRPGLERGHFLGWCTIKRVGCAALPSTSNCWSLRNQVWGQVLILILTLELKKHVAIEFQLRKSYIKNCYYIPAYLHYLTAYQWLFLSCLLEKERTGVEKSGLYVLPKVTHQQSTLCQTAWKSVWFPEAIFTAIFTNILADKFTYLTTLLKLWILPEVVI